MCSGVNIVATEASGVRLPSKRTNRPPRKSERMGLPDDLVRDAFLREDPLQARRGLPEQERERGGYRGIETIHATPPGDRATQRTNSRATGIAANGNRPASSRESRRWT